MYCLARFNNTKSRAGAVPLLPARLLVQPEGCTNCILSSNRFEAAGYSTATKYTVVLARLTSSICMVSCPCTTPKHPAAMRLPTCGGRVSPPSTSGGAGSYAPFGARLKMRETRTHGSLVYLYVSLLGSAADCHVRSRQFHVVRQETARRLGIHPIRRIGRPANRISGDRDCGDNLGLFAV